MPLGRVVVRIIFIIIIIERDSEVGAQWLIRRRRRVGLLGGDTSRQLIRRRGERRRDVRMSVTEIDFVI